MLLLETYELRPILDIDKIHVIKEECAVIQNELKMPYK